MFLWRAAEERYKESAAAMAADPAAMAAAMAAAAQINSGMPPAANADQPDALDKIVEPDAPPTEAEKQQMAELSKEEEAERDTIM